MGAQDRLEAHAADVLSQHATDMPTAVDAYYKLLKDEPALLFTLMGERAIKGEINIYLADIVAGRISLPRLELASSRR